MAHPFTNDIDSKVCIKSPCTSISASSAVLTVHGLLIQTLRRVGRDFDGDVQYALIEDSITCTVARVCKIHRYKD